MINTISQINQIQDNRDSRYQPDTHIKFDKPGKHYPFDKSYMPDEPDNQYKQIKRNTVYRSDNPDTPDTFDTVLKTL